MLPRECTKSRRCCGWDSWQGTSAQLILQRGKVGAARGRVLLLRCRRCRTCIQRAPALVAPATWARARARAIPAVPAGRAWAALRGIAAPASKAAGCRGIEAHVVAQALQDLKGGVLPCLFVAARTSVAHSHSLKLAAIDDQPAARQAAGRRTVWGKWSGCPIHSGGRTDKPS